MFRNRLFTKVALDSLGADEDFEVVSKDLRKVQLTNVCLLVAKSILGELHEVHQAVVKTDLLPVYIVKLMRQFEQVLEEFDG